MKNLGKIYSMALSTNSEEGDCNDSHNIIVLLSTLLRRKLVQRSAEPCTIRTDTTQCTNLSIPL